MKKAIKYISYMLLLFLVACSKEKIDAPTFEIEVSSTKVNVGEPLVVTINGSAETFSIFTGEPGFDYRSSHLFINAGKDVDYEDVWLPEANVPLVMAHLQPHINSHNNNANNDQTLAIIDANKIQEALLKIAGTRYTNSELLRVKIFDIILDLTGVKALSEEIVNLYSENNNQLLAPAGGYSRGFPIDRIGKKYTHEYSTPGTYVLTVVGTNVSRKLYSGDGYNTNRTSSGDEYRFERTVKEVTITVL